MQTSALTSYYRYSINNCSAEQPFTSFQASAFFPVNENSLTKRVVPERLQPSEALRMNRPIGCFILSVVNFHPLSTLLQNISQIHVRSFLKFEATPTAMVDLDNENELSQAGQFLYLPNEGFCQCA